MEDSNNDEDEDTHSDQRDGREQHAVAGSEVQFCTPTEKQSQGWGCETRLTWGDLFHDEAVLIKLK